MGHEKRDTECGGDHEERDTECGGDQEEPAEVHQVDSGQGELHRRQITLNRRQRRTIQQGIQRGLQTHEKIHEVFAGDTTCLDSFGDLRRQGEVLRAS